MEMEVFADILTRDSQAQVLPLTQLDANTPTQQLSDQPFSTASASLDSAARLTRNSS